MEIESNESVWMRLAKRYCLLVTEFGEEWVVLAILPFSRDFDHVTSNTSDKYCLLVVLAL